MRDVNPIIMLKPDAIDTLVPKEIAISLFYAFANHLAQNEVVKLGESMSVRERKAQQQVHERSLSEPNFQGDLRVVDGSIIARLPRVAQLFADDVIPAFKVITLGIQSIGYEVIQRHEYRLLPSDVDAIYCLENSNTGLQDLSMKLHSYLDNRIVILMKLDSKYGTFLLQHWKTFVRHFLILNRTEEFPLVNLIHVCENEWEYSNQLLLR